MISCGTAGGGGGLSEGVGRPYGNRWVCCVRGVLVGMLPLLSDLFGIGRTTILDGSCSFLTRFARLVFSKSCAGRFPGLALFCDVGSGSGAAALAEEGIRSRSRLLDFHAPNVEPCSIRLPSVD